MGGCSPGALAELLAAACFVALPWLRSLQLPVSHPGIAPSVCTCTPLYRLYPLACTVSVTALPPDPISSATCMLSSSVTANPFHDR